MPSPVCSPPATAASPASRAPGPSGAASLPATALPCRYQGQAHAELEQGRWDLGRDHKALMLSRGSQEHWPSSSLLFTAQSLWLLPLPVTFLIFSASSSMGKRRYPLTLLSLPSSTATSGFASSVWRQLIPPELPLGQAGRAGYATPPAHAVLVLSYTPRPWGAEQGHSILLCWVTWCAPAAAL